MRQCVAVYDEDKLIGLLGQLVPEAQLSKSASPDDVTLSSNIINFKTREQ